MAQAQALEDAFETQLNTLATASRSMLHTAAEEDCKRRGMSFHRVEPDSPHLTAFEKNALRDFQANPTLESQVSHEVDAQGEAGMYVLAPARLKAECTTCHQAYGLELFKDRKAGDVVAAFGVSASKQQVHQEARKVRRIGLALGFGAILLIGLLLTTLVRRLILKPLSSFSASIQQMADGDLTAQAAVTSHDEIGSLGIAFNGMVSNLHDTLKVVRQASGQVASKGHGLATSSNQMASAVAETAHVGEALNQSGRHALESMDGLMGRVERLSEHARRTRNETVEVAHNVEHGTEAGRSATHDMQEIREATARIDEAVQVIQEIARQTNLLSLNAGIEAAKAGVHGKGFSVVAEEIRKLAERSAHAAREIKTILERTREAVRSGVQSVGITLEHLESVEQRITSVSDRMNDMEALTAEQTKTGDQVRSLMDETGQRLEQNATSTNEMEAQGRETHRTAGELAQVANDLEDLVKRFRL
ncbi:MAG: methyl-accepting chemotaxis protein [Firmicutes bacterium]|nr:methyl-accepting chemotaxis protein [Bacillota bacterium]